VFTIPILAFTMSDLGVHVAPIHAFTFNRSGRSRSAGTRIDGKRRCERTQRQSTQERSPLHHSIT